jgi:hypothetical protein
VSESGATRQGLVAARLRPLLADWNALAWAASALLALGVTAAVTVPTWNDPGNPLDEGLLLVEPELLLEGTLPYRDYESFYGPANTDVLAAVYAVTGPEVASERAVGLAYRLAVVAAVLALAAPFGLLVALAGGIVAGLFTVGPAALAWYGGLAAALWSLWSLLRAVRAEEPAGWARWAGIAAGVAIAFRPQFAAAVALGFLPLLAGRPLRFVRSLALWALVGALPLLVHLALAGPVAFRNLIADALFRSGPQSTLPIPPLSSPEGKLLALLLGAQAVLLVGAGIAWRRAPGDPEARRIASIALLSVGLLPQALGRIESQHILNVGCVTIALLPTVLASPLVGGRISTDARRLGAVAVTAIAVLLGAQTWLDGVEANLLRALGPSPDPVTASFDRRENWVTRGSRSFPFYSAEGADQVRSALAAIDDLSAPGDRVVIGPEDLRRTFLNHTALYHLLPELEPATYYLTMAPGTANRSGSRLADDVAGADIMVLGTGADWRQVAPNSELESAEAAEALEADFCLRASPFPYRIYTRCGEPS